MPATPIFSMFLRVGAMLNPRMAFFIDKLGGGTFKSLIGRAFRLRRLAGNMVRRSLSPPLPVRLQMETTDTCNFKCIMCTREVMDGMNSRTIPLDDFIKVVDSIVPYYVTMNGLGEPLLDNTIFKKLDYLHQKNMMTSMPTNGTYIRRDKRLRLAESMPDILQLSIDGATKESFEGIRKLSDFDEVIENYQAICALKADGKTRAGTKIRVLCAMQTKNLHDYREMYRLISSLLGLDSFSAVPVFDYGAAGEGPEGIVPRQEAVIDLHSKLDAVIAETTDDKERKFYRDWRDVSAEWLDVDAPNRVDPASNTAPCVVPWFSTYIDAKGQVLPCCYLSNSKHIMGNIHDTPFPEIWSGETYQKFREKLVSDRPGLPGCSTCPRNDRPVLESIENLGVIATFGTS